MGQKTLRKFKWIWGWQDQREEAWLRQMSQAGWHLKEPGTMGFYTFMQGEPRDYVYRLDFRNAPQGDRQEYLQLFQDAGWEYLGEAMGWQYFRTLARSGESPEVFTDNDSKIQTYQRMLAFMAAMVPGQFLIYLLVMDRLPAWPVVLLTALLLVEGWITVQILRRINQLKRI